MNEPRTDTTQKKRRLLLIVALLVVGAVFATLAFTEADGNLTYYWSPSQLVDAGHKAQGASVRLGGLVVPDSVRRGADGLQLDFEVTDGEVTVPVHASTVPPAMFRGGTGVVVEGTLRADGVFETQRLMVKHDNEYRAPGEDDTRSVEELVRSLRVEPET